MPSRNSYDKARAELGVSKNAKLPQILNAKIRRDFVGGEDTLNAIETLDRLARRLKDSGHPHQHKAAQHALHEIRRLRDMMQDAACQWFEQLTGETIDEIPGTRRGGSNR